MPLRSPKMYSFIFGFHRLVWWPKCTPASRRSFNAIGTKCPPHSVRREPDALTLTFTELEALARARHAVFLAFLRTRVAREEAFVLQRLAQLAVVLDECPRNPEPHRAGLSRHTAPRDGREDVELVAGFRQHERNPDLGSERFGREER